MIPKPETSSYTLVSRTESMEILDVKTELYISYFVPSQCWTNHHSMFIINSKQSQYVNVCMQSNLFFPQLQTKSSFNRKE